MVTAIRSPRTLFTGHCLDNSSGSYWAESPPGPIPSSGPYTQQQAWFCPPMHSWRTAASPQRTPPGRAPALRELPQKKSAEMGHTLHQLLATNSLEKLSNKKPKGAGPWQQSMKKWGQKSEQRLPSTQKPELVQSPALSIVSPMLRSKVTIK